MIDNDNDCGATCGINDWQGKPIYSQKSGQMQLWAPQSHPGLFLVSNPGRRGGKTANNRLSYGTPNVISSQLFILKKELKESYSITILRVVCLFSPSINF
jgi:hypothetical protein